MERKPFPSEPESFGDDTRISYSKITRTYVLEDETGTEWEWLPAISKWTKTITEEEMKQQAEAYKMAGVDENTPALNPGQKRKEAQLEDAETNPKAAKSATGATSAGSHANASASANATDNGSASAAPAPRKNTAIYVTGLPLDTDRSELSQFFSRFGMIKESVENDEKRIIMYADDDGNFKGEALIIFQGPQSVPLAQYYDGEPLRIEDNSTKMSIEPADFSFKAAQPGNTVKEGGNNAKPKPSKAKAKMKAEEVKRRLGDWSDDEEPLEAAPRTDHLKTVIIKKAFSLNDLDEEPDYVDGLYDDMMEEGKTHGDVKNVTVFDKEPAGVVTIRFGNATSAQAFAAAVSGRGYNGRKLVTELSPNFPKFRKTQKVKGDQDEAELHRLEDYGRHIEAGD